MGFAIMLWFCGNKYQINGYSLKNNFSFPVSVAGLILLIFGIFQSKQIKLKAFGAAILGLLYISLSWGLMMSLRASDKTAVVHLHDSIFVFAIESLPIVIIASIWINDTMAYLVGSLIGKKPLSKISPKKTWEGTIGGITLCIVLPGILFSLIYWSEIHLVFVLMLVPFAVITSIVGTFGDLLESKLKRMAGVKDTGSFMPGFGGFLDRFDSMLLAIPAVWLYVYFFIG
jgi:phosphatidate cytidylyltransferase